MDSKAQVQKNFGHWRVKTRAPGHDNFMKMRDDYIDNSSKVETDGTENYVTTVKHWQEEILNQSKTADNRTEMNVQVSSVNTSHLQLVH